MNSEQVRRVGNMRRLAACGAARTIREQQGYSLRELAVLVGAGPATISRWETGQSRPRAGAALRWADALELDQERVA